MAKNIIKELFVKKGNKVIVDGEIGVYANNITAGKDHILKDDLQISGNLYSKASYSNEYRDLSNELIQSDWEEIDENRNTFIKNKPTIPTLADEENAGLVPHINEDPEINEKRYLRGDNTWQRLEDAIKSLAPYDEEYIDDPDFFHPKYMSFTITKDSEYSPAESDGIYLWVPFNDTSTQYGQQFFINNDGYEIYHRYYNNGDWSDWKRMYDDDYHPVADRADTATLANTATYATTAGSATDNTKLPLSGGTLNGDLHMSSQHHLYLPDTSEIRMSDGDSVFESNVQYPRYKGAIPDRAFPETGLAISQQINGEPSGIYFNDNNIIMWSPCDDGCLQYYDTDSGNLVWEIDAAGHFSGSVNSATYKTNGGELAEKASSWQKNELTFTLDSSTNTLIISTEGND